MELMSSVHPWVLHITPKGHLPLQLPARGASMWEPLHKKHILNKLLKSITVYWVPLCFTSCVWTRSARLEWNRSNWQSHTLQMFLLNTFFVLCRCSCWDRWGGRAFFSWLWPRSVSKEVLSAMSYKWSVLTNQFCLCVFNQSNSKVFVLDFSPLAWVELKKTNFTTKIN